MELKQIAIEKDNNDDLKSFKSRFVNNDNEIYLDGNSLGKLPVVTENDLISAVKNEWGQNLISSWNDNWLKMSEKINFKMSKLRFGVYNEGWGIEIDLMPNLGFEVKLYKCKFYY